MIYMLITLWAPLFLPSVQIVSYGMALLDQLPLDYRNRIMLALTDLR